MCRSTRLALALLVCSPVSVSAQAAAESMVPHAHFWREAAGASLASLPSAEYVSATDAGHEARPGQELGSTRSCLLRMRSLPHPGSRLPRRIPEKRVRAVLDSTDRGTHRESHLRPS